MCKYI